jgi:hypothetical protein
MLKNIFTLKINLIVQIFTITAFLVSVYITPALAVQKPELYKSENKLEHRSDEWIVQNTYRLKQKKDGIIYEYILEKLKPKDPNDWFRTGRFRVYRDGLQIYEAWGFDDPPSNEGWAYKSPIIEVYDTVMFSLHSGGTSCCTTIGIWLGHTNEGGLLFYPLGMNKASVHDFNKNNRFELILYEWENTHSLIPEPDSIDVKFIRIFEYTGVPGEWFNRVKGPEFKVPLMKHADKMYKRIGKYLKIGNMKNAQAAAAAWLAAVESTEGKEEIKKALQAFRSDIRFSEDSKKKILNFLINNGYPLLGVDK